MESTGRRSYCIFCYQLIEVSAEENPTDLEREVTEDRFLKLLERRLQQQIDFRGSEKLRHRWLTSETFWQLISKLFKDGFHGRRSGLSCESCCKIQASFCDFVHQIKVLEMKMDWQLRKLERVMRYADKVTSRVERFRENYFEGGSREVKLVVLDFARARSQLLALCSQMQQDVYPKVFLKRVRQDPPSSSLGGKNRKINVVTDTAVANEIPCVSSDIVGGGFVTAPLKREDCGIQDTTTLMGSHDMEWDGSSSILSFPIESSLGVVNGAEVDVTMGGKVLKVMSEEHRNEPTDAQAEVESNYFDGDPDDRMSELGIGCSDLSTAKEAGKEELLRIRVQDAMHLPMSKKKGTKTAMAGNSMLYKDDSSKEQSNQTLLHGRSLRAVHRCKTCQKTFSSEANLVTHLESHKVQTPDFDITSDDGDDDMEGCESSSLSSSSSSSDYEDFSEEEVHTRNKKRRTVAPQKRTNRRVVKRGRDGLKAKKAGVGPDPDPDTNRGLRENGASLLRSLDKATLNLKLTEDGLTLAEFLKRAGFSTSKKYICSVDNCKFRCFLRWDLDLHSKLHGEFPCEFCSFVAHYAPDLALHEGTHHSDEHDKVLKLPPTNQKGSRRTRVLNGKAYVARKERAVFRCARCEYCTTFRSRFLSHHLREHQDLVWSPASCPICFKSFPRKDFCPREFSSHFHRFHDVRGMEPERIKRCDKCIAYFRRRTHLKIHLERIHRLGLSRTCPECGLTLPNGKALSAHKVNNHYSQSARFQWQCSANKCYKRFATKSDLQKHLIRVHQDGSAGPVPSKVTSSADDEGPRFSCEDCNQIFDDEDDLIVHTSFHSNDTKVAKIVKSRPKYFAYQCPKCERTFTLSKFLRSHLQEEHKSVLGEAALSKEAIVLCRVKMSSKEEQNLKSITVTADGLTLQEASFYRVPPRYFCQVEGCKEAFMLEQELTNHSKWHGEFPCSQCDKVEAYAPDLALHEANHRSEQATDTAMKFNCFRCDFESCVRNTYISHYLEKHLALPSQRICPICQYQFKRISRQGHGRSVFRHFMSFHDISGLEEAQIARCDECSAYFKQFSTLIAHKQTVHSGKAICKHCAKSISNRSELLAHYKEAHSDPVTGFQFACPVDGCDKRFASSAKMERHKRNCALRVDGATCPKCGKHFKYSPSLNTHLRMHDRIDKGIVSSYVCDECGKVFFKKEQLRIHKLSHSGPDSWKFTCEVCSVKRMTKAKLEEHMRSHTKEKPFVCLVCGMKYAGKHNLNVHMATKHP